MSFALNSRNDIVCADVCASAWASECMNESETVLLSNTAMWHKGGLCMGISTEQSSAFEWKQVLLISRHNALSNNPLEPI